MRTFFYYFILLLFLLGCKNIDKEKQNTCLNDEANPVNVNSKQKEPISNVSSIQIPSLKDIISIQQDSIDDTLVRNIPTAISTVSNPEMIKIDTVKIYEESEVKRAWCSMSESQLLNFVYKNFKYPSISPISGKGKADLIIERDGMVSDVIIV